MLKGAVNLYGNNIKSKKIGILYKALLMQYIEGGRF